VLRDAADYIAPCRKLHRPLPKKESDLPEWQAAIEVLMLVSRGRPDDDDGPDRRHAWKA
jgi:hypothetical protein